MSVNVSVTVPSRFIGEIRFSPAENCRGLYEGRLVLDGTVLDQACGETVCDIFRKMCLGDGYKIEGDYYRERERMRRRESFTLRLWQEAVVR